MARGRGLRVTSHNVYHVLGRSVSPLRWVRPLPPTGGGTLAEGACDDPQTTG